MADSTQITTWSESGIDLKGRSKGKLKTYCPKCQSSRGKKPPSLSVNIDKGLWKCHRQSCNWSGSLFSRKDYRQKEAYTIPEYNNTPLSDAWLNYFVQTRKISKATLLRWQVTEESNWAVFNYFRDGVLVNRKKRSATKDMRLESNAELILYGWDLLLESQFYREEKRVIITEGEIDALSFYESGIYGVVSVPNGANKNTKYLDSVIDEWSNVKQFILAVDEDDAGAILLHELARRLGKHRCAYVSYPAGCKDANETLVEYGSEEVKLLVSNAIPFPIDRVLSVPDLESPLYDLYRNGIERGIGVGIEKFDSQLSFKTPQLTIITGIPSHGKSVLVENLLLRLMVKHDKRYAIFSPEHYPMELHLQRLAKILIGRPFFGSNKMTINELNQATSFLRERLHYIYPQDDSISLDEILETSSGLVARHAINGLVIDPWNEIDHNYQGHTETQYTDKALRKIKHFKNKHEVDVFLIAHPTKIPRENGKFSKPNLYSVNGSAAFYNKADNGIVVYRNFDTNTTEVLVEKVKFRHLGTVGSVTMKYCSLNERFYDATRSEDRYNWLEKLQEAKKVSDIEKATQQKDYELGTYMQAFETDI